MNRLGLVDPSAAPAAVKAVFDGPLANKHFNIFMGLANSPAALDAYLALSGALAKTSLTSLERETLQLVFAQASNCEYCVAAHTVIGKSAGLSTEQTVEARRGSMSDKRLDALVRFGLSVHEKRGLISEGDYRAFIGAGFTAAHAAEVVGCYALAVLTNTFNHVNQTAVDFPAPPRI